MANAYDTKTGRLGTAFTLSFTVVPKVLRSGEFWFFLVLHLAVFTTYHMGLLGESTTSGNHDFALNWDFVKVVTAMTTFFEVFYSNQCYGRYIGLYKSTRGMLDDAHSFAALLRTHVGERSRNHARLAVRYMASAMLIQFSELKSSCPESTLAELCRLELLKPEEAQALRQTRRQHRGALMLGWSSLAASAGCVEAKAPNNLPGLLSQAIFKLRNQQQDILDTIALPVPFHYYHLLSVMIIMNLSLWAYSMGLTDSVFAPLVFVSAALMFIGMMELSSELADPFGSDEVDFPVDAWLTECLELLTEVSESEYPGGEKGLALAAQREVALPRVVQDLAIMRQVQEDLCQRERSIVEQELSARDHTPLLTGSSTNNPGGITRIELAELGRSGAPPAVARGGSAVLLGGSGSAAAKM